MEGNNGVTMEKLTDARRKEEMKKGRKKKIKMHMEALTKSSWLGANEKYLASWSSLKDETELTMKASHYTAVSL